MRPDTWDNILAQGEEILWQGRPTGTYRLSPSKIGTIAFGVFFSGFALFWMILAAQAGGFFWAFGLLHFFVGIAVAAGPIIWDRIEWHNTWYTLTSQRAFIATDMPLVGRKLKSYEIAPSTVLDLHDRAPLYTIYFAHEYKKTKNSSKRIDIGFEGIPDGPDVMKLMRQVQKVGAA